MKKINHKVLSFIVAALMIFANISPSFAATDLDSNLKEAPTPTGTNYYSPPTQKIEFKNSAGGAYIYGLKNDTSAVVKVNGEEYSYTAYAPSSSTTNATMSFTGLNVDDIISISTKNYETLYLKVTSSNFSVEKTTASVTDNENDNSNNNTGDENNNVGNNVEYSKTTASPPSFSKESYLGSAYYLLSFSDADYVSEITEILCNDNKCEEASSMFSLDGTKYIKNTDQNTLSLGATSWSSSSPTFKDGDIITIKNNKYNDMQLKVSIVGSNVTIALYDGNQDQSHTLYVRLTGYFESAIVNQKGYDAISGASTNVTQNQNSNAQVEAVLVENGTKLEDISEDLWKPLSECDIHVDKNKTSVNLDNESGMVGVYSTYDSSITLSGTPAKAGTYNVSVTVTDDQGRTATSNSLEFKVYSGDEKLIDQMVTENFRHGESYWDGKYIWDLEPWTIKEFGGTNETVTVPTNLKAIYGSNTSGTYGYLGYAISEGSDTTQTLIIPKDAHLTLVNMNILSSVKIIVEEGGNLTLMDSVIDGVVEVNGGSFSMYDSSSINGQVVLNDGATLNSSVIYSNTNNIANGNEARHNTSPLLVVNGNVTLGGDVYIKGDEAPTGTDPTTGKEYTGQRGIQVNGTLNIPEDTTLAVYGGGHLYTTSIGGSAVILNDGTITGDGTLIALGGTGTKEGADAVEGTGTISVANAYLQGGNSAYKNAPAGKAISKNIKLANTTNRNLVDGIENGGFDVANYWGDITSTPDLALYTIDENAPGEDDNDKNDNNVNDDEFVDLTNPPSSDKSPSNNQQTTVDKTVTPDSNENADAATTDVANSASETPKTGDNSRIPYLAFLTILSLAVICSLKVYSKKH